MACEPKPEHLNAAALARLQSGSATQSFWCALAGVLNSDDKYNVKSLSRLVYPHRHSRPCVSECGVYLVKLIVNGIGRCLAVDGIVDQSVFWTSRKEVYPFLLHKALSQVYSQEQLARLAPNLIVYRMTGWMPETVRFDEIGDSAGAFDKLKRGLETFALIASFEHKESLLPLLDLEVDEKTGRRVLVTMRADSGLRADMINTHVLSTPNARPRAVPCLGRSGVSLGPERAG